MSSRLEIVTFLPDDPPPGESPYVEGAGPSPGVRVVDYDPAWPGTFETLRRQIVDALGWRAIQIEHVGSTAVGDLPAKPVIDVDLVVAAPDEEARYVPALVDSGFELRVREPWWYGHRVLRLVDPACHLHVFGPDSPEVVRHRIFRDWLRGSSADRDLYAATKLAAADAASRAGEHSMQYNARKQAVVREIYGRAFTAAGLLD